MIMGLMCALSMCYEVGVMPALAEAIGNAEISVKKAVPPQLARYCFKRGNPAPARAGRPPGTRNSMTILEEAAPKIAKHFIKRSFQSDPVLIDAMRRILPIDQPAVAATQVVVFIGSDGEHGLPR